MRSAGLPKTTRSKALPEAIGALTRDKYNVGDFVSLDQYVVKTPGRLPSGYGQESNVNMFHGGTIFRDAASKIIHVENQVSLGAGETLASKVSFEQWLWEISMAQVKHYHSDNGIFASAEFCKQCEEDS